MATLQSNMSLPWSSSDEVSWRQNTSYYATTSTEQKATRNSRFSPFSACDSTPELVADESADSTDSSPGSPVSQYADDDVHVEDSDYNTTSVSRVTKTRPESIPAMELSKDWCGREWDRPNRSSTGSPLSNELQPEHCRKVKKVATYALKMKSTKTGREHTVLVNLHNKKDVALAHLESKM
ncbi:hypothetical protein EJ05DRAFT_487746 [Pseudovirgaria hyperparasitica]|uniref:Uncharacterized protein n=1 Tax=Pseudovirgaria hyperparasitica TaxID=470096 RepID=A0A6A6W055_9PEZI|nr:uncharacterized protein EJ05DRAFT_487746 [Pseudovirgaria hyperparasitica]KAF2755923.1 hypothetical protein EJ05DRAFT_487746 [Pseudovirgaria hyperparasitica]